MTVTPHLIRLYLRTSRRYRKLISKLRRGSLSAWQRNTFLHELKKLVRTLRGLQSQLKVAAATGGLVLMLNAGEVQAQTAAGPTVGPFVRQDRLNNPLREPILIGQKNGTKAEPAIAIIDFDKDGDYDVVVGQYDYFNGGFLRYFENIEFEETPFMLNVLAQKTRSRASTLQPREQRPPLPISMATLTLTSSWVKTVVCPSMETEGLTGLNIT